MEYIKKESFPNQPKPKVDPIKPKMDGYKSNK